MMINKVFCNPEAFVKMFEPLSLQVPADAVEAAKASPLQLVRKRCKDSLHTEDLEGMHPGGKQCVGGFAQRT